MAFPLPNATRSLPSFAGMRARLQVVLENVAKLGIHLLVCMYIVE